MDIRSITDSASGWIGRHPRLRTHGLGLRNRGSCLHLFDTQTANKPNNILHVLLLCIIIELYARAYRMFEKKNISVDTTEQPEWDWGKLPALVFLPL